MRAKINEMLPKKKKIDDDMPKVWGFSAMLDDTGRYKMDVNTNGCNFAQLSVLIALNEKIKEWLMKSIKEIESQQTIIKNEDDEDES